MTFWLSSDFYNFYEAGEGDGKPCQIDFKALLERIVTMLTTQLTFDIQIFDTDCYGVMWHGAYTKWLEMGRVKHLEAMGVSMDPPGQPGGFVFPVTEQRFKFLAPGKMGDDVVLETTVEQAGFQLKFLQSVTNTSSEKKLIDVETTVVVLNTDWQLQRRLPEHIQVALAKSNETASTQIESIPATMEYKV